MAFPIETLETFFAAKFYFEESFGLLTYFDGYAYWHLLWMPGDGQFLKIFAGRDEVPVALPTVEIEGRYSNDVSIRQITGVGTALILRPEGSLDPKNCVTITKRKDGRLSLSITV